MTERRKQLRRAEDENLDAPVTLRQPVPLWLSAFLIALAVFSVGYTFNEQRVRTEAFEQQRISDDEDDRRVEGLVEDLQVQQQRAENERERLRLLIAGLLAADTSEERRRLMEEFVEEEVAADERSADQDEANPPGEPSTNDDGVTEQQGEAQAPAPMHSSAGTHEVAPPDPPRGGSGKTPSRPPQAQATPSQGRRSSSPPSRSVASQNRPQQNPHQAQSSHRSYRPSTPQKRNLT